MTRNWRLFAAYSLAFAVASGVRWTASYVGLPGRFALDGVLFGTFALMAMLFRRWFGVTDRRSPYSEPPDPLKLRD